MVQLPDYQRNPVIVIPGVLGSRLVDDKTGKLTWGKFDHVRLFRRTPEEVYDIALPMREGVPLDQLRDSIRSDGTLAYLEIEVAGVPIEIQAYDQMLHALGVGGYHDSKHPQFQGVNYGDDHFTCFQFDYDWRRDVVENSILLHEFIENRREYIRQEYHRRYGIENATIKFDIVAHSMGGLIARYYLRYGGNPLPEDGSLPALDWSGAENVARVVLIGTPNAGSALAIQDLVQGHQFAPLLPKYSAAVLGTMPAIYQLLPRDRHETLVDTAGQPLDVSSPNLWRELNWGLANPDQDQVLQKLLPDVANREDRLRIAIDHQRKCLLRASQLQQALDIPSKPPPGVTFHLFAGDSIETPAVFEVDLESQKLKLLSMSAGDDSTTRASALMDERTDRRIAGRLVSPINWTSTMFLHTSHRKMTGDPIFIDNVLSLLLESPTVSRIPSNNFSRQTRFIPPQSITRLPPVMEQTMNR